MAKRTRAVITDYTTVRQSRMEEQSHMHATGIEREDLCEGLDEPVVPKQGGEKGHCKVVEMQHCQMGGGGGGNA